MAIKTDTFQGAGGGGGAVTSVNTQTGAVVLSANDLAADHTASNYTAANSNIDGHLSGIDTKLGTIASGLTYKGTFDATAGTPSLTNALKGDLYVIGTAGTIYGQTWAVGDHLLINEDMGGTITNSKIDKIDNTDQVTSVNGNTGAVVLSGDDLAADHSATNYTAANANVDGHLSGIDTKLGSLGTGASETTAGLIEIATNAEAAAATATDKALVPSNIPSLDLSKMDNTTSGFISSVASASETVQGIIEIATNAEAAAGTATDKALVPSNISSLDLSAMDNTTSGFIANINSESLNDLSDVSYTAGAGIDNYVLTYDHSTTSWGAEASPSGGLSEVSQDPTPQLGGPLDVNGQIITSDSNGNVTIDPDGTGDISIGADIIPDADATHTIGDEDNRFISYYGDMNGAIRFKAKNDEGGQITKGQVVYIKGLAGDGTTPTVALADADDSAKMPAFGLAFNTANDQAEVQIVSFGNLGGLDTSGFSVGDTLFVGTTAGALVATKPTGETSLLQNIGRVVRSDNGAGVIKVGGAGRTAATPNLNQDKIFLGNASNQAVSTALSAIALSSFNDDLNYLSNLSEDETPQLGGPLDVAGQDIVSASNGDIEIAPNGTGSTVLKGNATGGSGHIKFNCEQNSHAVTIKAPTHTDISTGGSYTLTLPINDGDANQVLKTDGSGVLSWVDQPAGASPASETVAGVIEIATNAEAGAATATDKALVPSNIASLDLSAMDNTTSGFISSVASASETVSGVIEIATNAEAAAGTATDKALVPSNIASLDLSAMDNTTSGFIANINSESLNDLSDVSYTAGAGIDNYVLTYDHSTTSWGAEAAAAGGGGWTYSAITADPANAQAGYHYSCTGTFTITLPTSGVSSGEEIRVKNMGTGTITIDPQTQNIDGSTTDYTMDVQYSAITLVSTGTHWEII
jgi:hypothetical protein